MVGKTNKCVTWRYHYPWKFLIKFKKKLLNNKSLKFSMEVLVWVLRHARYKIWVTANSISLNFELKKCIRFIVMPFSLPRISSSAVFFAYDLIVSHLYKMGITVISFSFTCIYYQNLEYFLCEKCVRLLWKFVFYRLLFSIFIAA